MIRKNAICLAFIISVVLLFTISVSAEEKSAADYLPYEIYQYIPDGGQGIEESVRPDNVLRSAVKSVADGLAETLESMAQIMCVVVMAAVFSLFRDVSPSTGSSRVYTLISSLCLSLVLYKILSVLWERTDELIGTMTSLMQAMLPVTTVIYASCGNVTQAAVNNSSMMIILTVLESLCSYALRPVLRICFGLTLISAASDSANLEEIASFVRKTFTGVLVFIMTAMTAALTLGNSIAKGSDGISLRAVKFAAGSFIPIIGSAVSEAVSTISGGMSYIKNTVGVLAIIALFVMVTPVIIRLVLCRVALSFGSTTASVFGLEGESKYIKGASELVNFLIAILTAVTVMFMVALIIFVSSAAALSSK